MFIELDNRLVNLDNVTEASKPNEDFFYLYYTGGSTKTFPAECYDTFKEAALGGQDDKKV